MGEGERPAGVDASRRGALAAVVLLSGCKNQAFAAGRRLDAHRYAAGIVVLQLVVAAAVAVIFDQPFPEIQRRCVELVGPDEAVARNLDAGGRVVGRGVRISGIGVSGARILRRSRGDSHLVPVGGTVCAVVGACLHGNGVARAGLQPSQAREGFARGLLGLRIEAVAVVVGVRDRAPLKHERGLGERSLEECGRGGGQLYGRDRAVVVGSAGGVVAVRTAAHGDGQREEGEQDSFHGVTRLFGKRVRSPLS